MRKLAILSTFVFAFGVAMLVTAPTADARPCICENAGMGDPDLLDQVCCRELSPDNPDPMGVPDNADPEGGQLTCGSIFLDDGTFVAGRIAADEATVAGGCISVGGAANTNDVLGGPGCAEDAVAACKRGGESCLDRTADADACNP